jgi:hypothetical protein
MEIKKMGELLTNISNVLKENKKSAKNSGKHFNIFSVMKMESDEVYTHSAIIGELLNPKGSHGQGSVFLKLFFEEIEELLNFNSFDFDNASVLVEKSKRNTNNEKTEGGRVDIVIEDKNGKNIIVIENKIYAQDQEGQLVRYIKEYPNCKLLYLTLFGTEPSKYSKRDLESGNHFNCISYKSIIYNWLNKCHNVIKNRELASLQEIVNQYINLIKKLTNQTMSNKIKKEVSILIQKNFLESQEIYNNFYVSKRKIVTGFWNDVKDVIEAELKNKDANWEVEINKNLFENDKFTYLLISKKENKNASFYWRYTTIEIEEKDLPNIDIHFGIILNSKTNNKDIVNLLKTKLTDQFFNILNDGYTSGTRSVIQKKYDRFTFNNNKLLAKIGIEKLNDLEINN